MYDSNELGKIKNDKIARWPNEWSTFKFDIIHRPCKVNSVADTLTRNVQRGNSVTIHDNKLV